MSQVSVIIPTYRRQDSLLRALRSLQDQTLRDFEIVVVDNAADAKVEQAVAAFNLTAAVPVCYTAYTRDGLWGARTRGIREAKGDILVFTDDDLTFGPGWLHAHLSAMQIHPDMLAAGGCVRPVYEQPPPEWLIRYMGTSKVFGILALMEPYDTFRLSNRGFFFGCNMAVRRSVFTWTGFHPELVGSRTVGDGETGMQEDIWAAGGLIGYVPEALAYHHIPAERMSVRYIGRWARHSAAGKMFNDWRLQPRLPSALARTAFRICRNYALTWLRNLLTPQHDTSVQAINLRFAASYGYARLVYLWWILTDPEIRRVLDIRDFGVLPATVPGSKPATPVAAHPGIEVEQTVEAGSGSIFVSVIIPTRNREKSLVRVLSSLTATEYPTAAYEVIVADSCSTDGTQHYCETEAPALFRHFRYERCSRPGLHVARHRGARVARGNILAYLDDDVRVTPSWLAALRAAFADGSVGLVGGPCLPEYEIPPPSWEAALWRHTAHGRSQGLYSILDFGRMARRIPSQFVYGCNFSVRKQVLFDCGGFHPDSMPAELLRFRGDGETALARQIESAEITAFYHPDACIYHFVSADRLTPSYLYRRAFAQGISNSFTEIRRRAGAEARLTLAGFREPDEDNPMRKSKAFLGAWFHHRLPEYRLRKLIQKGLADGSAFHQEEVRKSQELHAWVVRKDYWDEEASPDLSLSASQHMPCTEKQRIL